MEEEREKETRRRKGIKQRRFRKLSPLPFLSISISFVSFALSGLLKATFHCFVRCTIVAVSTVEITWQVNWKLVLPAEFHFNEVEHLVEIYRFIDLAFVRSRSANEALNDRSYDPANYGWLCGPITPLREERDQSPRDLMELGKITILQMKFKTGRFDATAIRNCSPAWNTSRLSGE